MLHFHVRLSSVAGLLPITFEAASLRLAALPRMFIEPDGSFVWTSDRDVAPSWQVDGTLVDRGESLYYVELLGFCPEAEFTRLLAILIADEADARFEWVERGETMNATTFRRQARASQR